MDVYFSPLACSLATRISLYESGGEARFHHVNLKTKTLPDGGDFLAINPKGQAPTIRTDDGDIITENAAILQHIADRAGGDLKLAGLDRSRLQEWLSFIGSELHVGVFGPLLDPKAPDSVKAYARQNVAPWFSYLDAQLAGRDYLLDRFSVADAYMTAVLNWTTVTGVDLALYPNVKAYYARLLARPAVSRAVNEEHALYKAAA